MKILYIFPHPDDEAFGPAGGISRQIRDGHTVYLLTLTRGGATKERFRLGLTVDEMGVVRMRELQASADSLGIKELRVLDLPDSKLADIDPRIVEQAVADYIHEIEPAVVVGYPVSGVSGFPDHLVAHATVKRVFLEMKDNGADYLRRLAFFTLGPESAKTIEGSKFKLKISSDEHIDCIIVTSSDERQSFLDSLDCYETYATVIAASNVKNVIGQNVYYEIFGECFNPPLSDLTAALP
ncbi:MAG: PIG-L family deacetylase [Bacteroidota bacterium]